ncbi:MAG TPA: glycosyl transferase, partial [Acinetobacter radioresistens]|nr:glycosyl transferase [Acinetobacter radioresistens]
MIGIVIPAHNEEEHLSDCLLAIQQAVDELPASVQVRVLV